MPFGRVSSAVPDRVTPGVALRVALGASLALNLVLGGLLLRGDGQDAAPGPRRLLERVERLLPEGDRTSFEAVVEARRPAMTEARARMREALEPIRAAIAAEPFDPVALRAAMARGRGPWNEFSNQFDDTLVAALTAISAEGRRRVAQDMPPSDRSTSDRGTSDRGTSGGNASNGSAAARTLPDRSAPDPSASGGSGGGGRGQAGAQDTGKATE